MRCVARAARRDDWNVHRPRDRAGELDVVADALPIPIDAREQDLAGAELFAAARPVYGVERGVAAATVRYDSPSVSRAARIDARDNTLRAEACGAVRQHLGTRDRRRVDAH